MLDTLAAYPGLVRSSIQVSVTYRGRMVIWLLTGFFPLLLMAVWLTVVDGGGAPAGWDTSAFVSYYVAAAVIYQLSGERYVWAWDAEMRSGDLSVRMLRPIHPFHQFVAADLGERIVVLAMLLPVLVLAALLIPAIQYPLTPVRAVEVVAAVVLAYALSLLMAATFALLGFWSTQTTNVYMLWWGAGSFASGWIAPLDLMPNWLQRIAVVLPFRSTIGFPVELLMGRLDNSHIAQGFAVGLAWLAVFVLLYLVGWRRGVRRYQAVAG